jgi:hypothetical protein
VPAAAKPALAPYKTDCRTSGARAHVGDRLIANVSGWLTCRRAVDQSGTPLSKKVGPVRRTKMLWSGGPSWSTGRRTKVTHWRWSNLRSPIIKNMHRPAGPKNVVRAVQVGPPFKVSCAHRLTWKAKDKQTNSPSPVRAGQVRGAGAGPPSLRGRPVPHHRERVPPRLLPGGGGVGQLLWWVNYLLVVRHLPHPRRWKPASRLALPQSD